jgi:hypothetical protein
MAKVHKGGTYMWVTITIIQAFITCLFLSVYWVFMDTQWEMQGLFLSTTGIVATWCLALRAIRSKIMDIFKQWGSASHGLLQQASRSGKRMIPVALTPRLERSWKSDLFSLRAIAGGVTIPFFVMPIFIGLVCMVLCWQHPKNMERWIQWVFLGPVLAMMVASYFLWSIVPVPISAAEQKHFAQRKRKTLFKP